MAKDTYRFIVLIPHRDTVKTLEAYRRRLFCAGIMGAYSFPLAAPLGTVSRPFTGEELKTLARSLRAVTAADGRNGKITIRERGVLPSPLHGTVFFGLTLDLSPVGGFLAPDVPLDIAWFPSIVLCTGVLSINADSAEEPLPDIPPPSCFFRAAMVANMVIRPLSSGAAGYSFEWKIGVPVWLPKYRKA